jgi:hypothetical protein
MLHYNGNSQLRYASIDHEQPFASQESPSNMLQPATSHHGKTYLVLEFLPLVLLPEEAAPVLGSDCRKKHWKNVRGKRGSYGGRKRKHAERLRNFV